MAEYFNNELCITYIVIVHDLVCQVKKKNKLNNYMDM